MLCEYAAPLLREGGALVAWKGAVDASEEADGLHAAEVLGMEREEVRAVEPYRGLRAPDPARLSQGRAHAGRAIRGGREWPQNAR